MIYLEPSFCRYEQSAQDFYYTAPWSGQLHRYRAWGAGCIPEIMHDGVWHYAPDDAVLPLLSTDLTNREIQHPATMYAAQIPREVSVIVAQYEIDQMVMLHLCALSERAVQLLRHSPNFLWFIGPFIARSSRGQSEVVHDLLGYSQKKLLEIAFGRATQGMVNMLKKAPPGVTSDERLPFMRALSNECCSAVLRHRRECQWPLFKIVLHYRDMLQYPFARKLFTENLPLEKLNRILSLSGEIYRDAVRLGRALRIDNADRFVSGCQNWRALRMLHETWTRRLNSEQEAQKLAHLAAPFPAPPIFGTSDILPIDTEDKLLTEGRIMRHCVGGYGDTVRSGASYIYQVLKPERATLELRLTRNGEWHIAQIKAHCNAAVSAKTRNAVQRWLLDAQSGNYSIEKGN